MPPVHARADRLLQLVRIGHLLLCSLFIIRSIDCEQFVSACLDFHSILHLAESANRNAQGLATAT